MISKYGFQKYLFHAFCNENSKWCVPNAAFPGEELHLSQQEKVYAVLDAFGERQGLKMSLGMFSGVVKVSTGWCPPSDVSGFINPINYSYIYHKP